MYKDHYDEIEAPDDAANIPGDVMDELLVGRGNFEEKGYFGHSMTFTKFDLNLREVTLDRPSSDVRS